MNMDIHEVFNDSYARCNRNPHFMPLFYERFLEKDETFHAMFAKIDMEKQMKMVKASLLIIMLAATSEQARETVKMFGKRHGPDGLGIKPLDIDIWFECLIDTIKECDPAYNQSVDQAWRQCFNEGISIMKAECKS
jgi:hemoglobin-like flavoprotein